MYMYFALILCMRCEPAACTYWCKAAVNEPPLQKR